MRRKGPQPLDENSNFANFLLPVFKDFFNENNKIVNPQSAFFYIFRSPTLAQHNIAASILLASYASMYYFCIDLGLYPLRPSYIQLQLTMLYHKLFIYDRHSILFEAFFCFFYLIIALIIVVSQYIYTCFLSLIVAFTFVSHNAFWDLLL